MSMLEKAITLAAEQHQGQVDKVGQPYVLHVLRVMFRLDDEDARIAAVLHDVVEDTDMTLDGLRERGFSEQVVRAVDSLTRRDDETYEQFVARAAFDPIGRKVKIADIEDNMDIRRLSEITEHDRERLNRYLTSWRTLRGMAQCPVEDSRSRERL